jgi:hypothetical protein
LVSIGEGGLMPERGEEVSDGLQGRALFCQLIGGKARLIRHGVFANPSLHPSNFLSATAPAATTRWRRFSRRPMNWLYPDRSWASPLSHAARAVDRRLLRRLSDSHFPAGAALHR